MSLAGRMLRHSRSQAGLTQPPRAVKVEIPQESIARIEVGRVDPRVGASIASWKAAAVGSSTCPGSGAASTGGRSEPLSACRRRSDRPWPSTRRSDDRHRRPRRLGIVCAVFAEEEQTDQIAHALALRRSTFQPGVRVRRTIPGPLA